MMADIVPYLEQLCVRFGQPQMHDAFHGQRKTIQFTFSDLQRDYTISIAEDGSATLLEHSVPKPDITVTTNSSTLAGIVDGTVNPIQAYITHRLRVMGNMSDLLILQKLL
jgi:putative sterol carrier protein